MHTTNRTMLLIWAACTIAAAAAAIRSNSRATCVNGTHFYTYFLVITAKLSNVENNKNQTTFRNGIWYECVFVIVYVALICRFDLMLYLCWLANELSVVTTFLCHSWYLNELSGSSEKIVACLIAAPTASIKMCEKRKSCRKYNKWRCAHVPFSSC